jgi:hypothetical protein
MRQVTTSEVDGKAVFVAPAPREPERSRGLRIWRLGGHDSLPAPLPAAGLPAEVGAMFPPASGFRVYRTILPPEAGAEGDVGIEGLDDLYEDGDFHRTDSVDVVWVLAGEVGLELDDGAIEWLEAGDVVVQNGTRHAWRNRSGADAMLGSICFGAVRDAAAGEFDKTAS